MVKSRKNKMTVLSQSLPFEKAIDEIENRLREASSGPSRKKIKKELEKECEAVFSNLTPWQRVLVARHALRPRMLDYTSRILEDFVELHGDKMYGDDQAMVGGLGRFNGQTIMVVGQQKGVSTEEKVRRNFGMAHPCGYRKALRLFKLAERWRIPIVTLVDTPAAEPGVEAERHGQGPAIAQNLLEMMRINTPILVIVLGEGGSGGALGVAVGDWVAMMEHAVYVICPPERCAEILWRDVEKKEMAASALRVTAADLKELGVIDKILKEPIGGAHRNVEKATEIVAKEIAEFLDKCKKNEWTLEKRQQKFRKMGVWQESAADTGGKTKDGTN